MSTIDDWANELIRVKMVAHARAYAMKGWPVFPVWWPAFAQVCACGDGDGCSSVAKHPLVRGGHTVATTDADVVSEWWEKWPFANIGIATGSPSGFTVLDVDEDKGGQASLHRMMAQYGRPDPTVVSETGGGGRHILWKHNASHRCQQSVSRGIDVRADGGYILAPPSLHASGIRYRWHTKGHPRSQSITCAPDWAEKMLRGEIQRDHYHTSKIPIGPIGEGERNMTMFRYACRFQRQGLPDDQLAEKTHELNNSLCRPPLSDKEVDKIISSALRYKKGN